ncbi:winged helix-turn-helix transcriptional regulator [Geobacter sp. DSM 9736]|uniref:winged helix-turn-helix transcriptional regulator n=1 Tax=Geobacter sp. DSM 9736 TaxID=1277350 RepID=UPI000B5125C9|nr:winged helix-turn-helix transcriptional regulator [Geobacter sp. DSM 9736]SNB46607.1 Winged helix-turn-helix DNA-binding [Geobacter sp. DSM 9736]
MNSNDEKILDTYRSFLLLAEIAKEEPLSQRELSRRLGIALGLVNSYIKNLVAKGYIRVKNFPKNRYGYLLTPQGVTEKSRLAYQHLSYFTNLYTTARQDYVKLFRSLQAKGVEKIVFCGVDEVAEIAYLSLQGTGIELLFAMDDERAGDNFFGRPVVTVAKGLLAGHYRIVITSVKKGEMLRKRLLDLGVSDDALHSIGAA